VLPETAVPNWLDQVDPAYLARCRRRAPQGGDLLLGVATASRQRSYYNSVVTPRHRSPQIYHKSHLVPFGEFVPPGFAW
jgi:apolipoprotein N-acyltransferase